MKNTLRQVFHSPKFVVGFGIFVFILLIMLIYPMFNPGNPLEMIGVGTFASPGTYVSLYDAVGTGTETLRLSDADDNRIAKALSAEDRVAMVEWFTAMGIDVSGLDINDTDALVDLWNDNYEVTAKPAGMTMAKRNYYKRLNNALLELRSADVRIIADENDEGDLEKVNSISKTDYVNIRAVANVKTLPLGTDNFGRDVLKELVSACGTSIRIGLIAGAVATIIGLTLGLLALYKMWNMDHQLTLLALIPALLMLAIGTVMGKTMTKTWEKRQQAFSDLSDFAQENFSGIAVIKAFVKELKELIAFRKLNKENEKINVEYTRISVLLEIMVTLFVESVICVILGFGGYLVYVGQFNAGQLVEYIGYFEAIVWPIMAVAMLIEKSSRGKASLNRITELLDAPIDVADRPGVPDLANVQGGVEFRDLTFRYPDGEFDVLKNISFTIQPGERVGIVGKTGAGKTALVDLLLRTYNVPDGTLFVDGKDVNTVSIHSVRNACAYVPQDNFLFSDTIAHNIGFGVDDATREDIDRAAALADVRDNIVDFKDGYETVLGERGVTVSGGQKQRISIARALLKNAPILILDDSVSAVDTRTEKIILDNLKASRAGKTTLLIAHRISTVEGLDKIIFLEDGRVEAVGPHDSLYASCPEYRRMVDLQRLEDEVGGDSNG